jgi:uroporphyrinogen decarboxylase
MDEYKDSLMLRAMRGENVERHPVWFMRQAGRYLKEYAMLKGGRNVLDVQADPETASEITMLPVRKLGVDAAVLYSDIMVPIKSVGYELHIEENIGPIADRLLDISDNEEIERIGRFDCERDAPYVLENIRLSREKLEGIPLIGFSGGPFTLFSYIIEGRPSRMFERSRKIIKEDPEGFERAMNAASTLITNYLKAQIRAGVSVVQIFDSWAGLLEKEEYERFVLGPTKSILSELPKNVPKIYFSAKTAGMLDSFAKSNPDFISVDPNTPIRQSYYRLDEKFGIQGNLDPELAKAGGAAMEKAVMNILDDASGISRFVFNLGHGVLKDTPPENLKKIVDIVKAQKI